MRYLQILWWLSLACIAYAYLIYPVMMAVAARLRPLRLPRTGTMPSSVSIILAAHNEAKTIAGRIRELLGLLDASGLSGELIVVSDGSTDSTGATARSFSAAPVRVIEMAENMGKAVALTRACAAARYPILIFADARQHWHPQALVRLLARFTDPAVGAVSGELIVESAPGVMAGVGLYWRYEKWLRRNEGRVHSTVGVTGAISAVRRELFRPIPPATLLDDLYWPLGVAMQGRRIVHEPTAIAYDRLPESPRDEFRRKVRTLSGNFQLLGRLPAGLLPWRNPIWFELLSHKVLRLLVPWAMLALFLLSAVIPGELYRAAFWTQIGFYGLAICGLARSLSARLRIASAASSLLVLNAAAWIAFWVWASGRAGRSWKKVVYESEPAGQPAGT